LIVYVLLFAMLALAVVTFTGFITESPHRRAPKRWRPMHESRGCMTPQGNPVRRVGLAYPFPFCSPAGFLLRLVANLRGHCIGRSAKQSASFRQAR